MKILNHSIRNQPHAGFIKQSLIASGLLGTPLLLSLVLSSLMALDREDIAENLDIAADTAELPLKVNQATSEFRDIWTLLLPKIEARG